MQQVSCRPVEARGWVMDVWRVVQGLGKTEFALADLSQKQGIGARGYVVGMARHSSGIPMPHRTRAGAPASRQPSHRLCNTGL